MIIDIHDDTILRRTIIKVPIIMTPEEELAEKIEHLKALKSRLTELLGDIPLSEVFEELHKNVELSKASEKRK
jgi:hypothetical protein